MNLSDMVRKMQELGYETDDAQARVCQDIVLKAISKSTNVINSKRHLRLFKNITLGLSKT